MTDTLHPGLPGSISRYNKLHCRCDECKANKAKLAKAQRLRRKLGLTDPRVWKEPEHGTMARYKAGKCRCLLCRGANTEAKRAEGGKARTRAGLTSKAAPTLRVQAPKAISLSDKVSFEHTPVEDCGEPLPDGGYCRRAHPCSYPAHREASYETARR